MAPRHFLLFAILLVPSFAIAQEGRNKKADKSTTRDSDPPIQTISGPTPEFHGAYRCGAGWFAIRPPYGGQSYGIFRVESYSGPFVTIGVAHKELGFAGYGHIISETGNRYSGAAFSTGFDGTNGPKWLFISQPEHYLFSFRTNKNKRWKFVDRCIKEDLLDLYQKGDKAAPKAGPENANKAL